LQNEKPFKQKDAGARGITERWECTLVQKKFWSLCEHRLWHWDKVCLLFASVPLGHEQRASRRAEVLSFLAERPDLSPPLLSFAGLLSSLSLNDEETETAFLELIRSSNYGSADEPHFDHVAGEFTDMATAWMYPPLINVVCGRIATPIMGASDNSQTRFPQVQVELLCDRELQESGFSFAKSTWTIMDRKRY
jgi:hypothetical protein